MRALLPIAALLLAGAAPPPLEVTGASFFAERIGDENSVDRVETTRVPYEPDRSCFRWELKVKPQPGVRALHERLTLPAPAASWGGVEKDPNSPMRINPGRNVADLDFIAALGKGELGNEWCVAEGDPQGAYKIELFDGTRLLHRFDFTVGVGGPARQR